MPATSKTKPPAPPATPTPAPVEPRVIQPQVGPQTRFLQSKADILIFGGAAGGGKTYALLLEPLFHRRNPLYAAVIFRRTFGQVTNPGGLWDTAREIYPFTGARGSLHAGGFKWPCGSRVKFSHLEHDKNVLDWQGSALTCIMFDELTHFTEYAFWYLQSRARGMSGIPAYVRATCNPQAKGWVKDFIAWWIDPVTKKPIPERSGIVRFMARENNKIVWADTREELMKRFGEKSVRSVTFIPSKLSDNKLLMEKDPSYEATLRSLSRADREELLEGKWGVDRGVGTLFKREWFKVLPAVPGDVKLVQQIRYWDRAATEATGEVGNDPDWTAGLRLAKGSDGKFYILHVARFRSRPLAVKDSIHSYASQDGCAVGLEHDPGSAGVAEIDDLVRHLAGFIVRTFRPSADKATRAKPVSIQAEAHNVIIIAEPGATWVDDLLSELEEFDPEKMSHAHDDQVDALSGAFNALSSGVKLFFSWAGEGARNEERLKDKTLNPESVLYGQSD